MNDPLPLETESVASCPVCGGADTRTLFANLEDRFYGVPGRWGYEQCLRCALLFLNPRPTARDVGRAYAVYPTHLRPALPRTRLRRFRSYARGGYLARKFGYTEGVGRLQRSAGALVYLHPGQREYINGSVMYLPANRRGRVLDVGAGAGEVLAELRRLGWEVEGVDPDAAAVEGARRNHGLTTLQAGTLEDQRYPAGSFDAVVSSHAIEHVHDPIGLLCECRRVLKPGGVLIVATPNAGSLGRRMFGADWRVLEPPRHLTVFSADALARALRAAGFASATQGTSVRGADGIFIESGKLRARGQSLIGESPTSLRQKLAGQLYQYALWAILRWRPDVGEELLVVAVR